MTEKWRLVKDYGVISGEDYFKSMFKDGLIPVLDMFLDINTKQLKITENALEDIGGIASCLALVSTEEGVKACFSEGLETFVSEALNNNMELGRKVTRIFYDYVKTIAESDFKDELANF